MLVGLTAPGLNLGCSRSEAGPKTIKGTIVWAAQSIEQHDANRLFQVIDQRTRDAMSSIVHDAKEEASLIQTDYPEGDQTAALATLGDAATVRNASELFALRCPEACRQTIGISLGAPANITHDGNEVVVRTARNTEFIVFRGRNQWYGIKWKYDEYDTERTRTNRSLELVRQNREVYRRRQQLE